MKSPLSAAAAILPIAAIALAGCAAFPQTGNIGKPLGEREFARVGEVMLHVNARDESQDAFGAAFFSEVATERGFSELCYAGLNTAMQPVFRRRDVEVFSGEAPAQPKAVRRLPEATAEFALDYAEGRLIAVRDRNIEIIEATPAGVTFTVQ